MESFEQERKISLASLPEEMRDGIVARLAAKSSEYHARMDAARDASSAAGTDAVNDEKYLDSAYKAFIADAVLAGHELTKAEAAERLTEHMPAPFYGFIFDRAWDVIESYVLHGGQGIRGGTGF